MRKVHRRFKAFFDSGGWTQQRMGKALGTSQVAVSKLLRGKFHTVSNEVAQRIERLTQDWEHGPIRASEWIYNGKKKKPTTEDEEPEPAALLGVAS